MTRAPQPPDPAVGGTASGPSLAERAVADADALAALHPLFPQPAADAHDAARLRALDVVRQAMEIGWVAAVDAIRAGVEASARAARQQPARAEEAPAECAPGLSRVAVELAQALEQLDPAGAYRRAYATWRAADG